MSKTAVLVALIVAALGSIPAHAQPLRVFVSGLGLDTNPCTVNQPCRTFQQAHDTAAANGEIAVLDPAGYGALTITKGISIQGHGFGGIIAVPCDAITIAVTTSDPVTLNGLLIDGGGAGQIGIHITSGSSVQVLNSVVRHFIAEGIWDQTNTNGSNLLIEDTIVLDNAFFPGIVVSPNTGGTVKATLNRIAANNNFEGVVVTGADVTIANSVLSNNSLNGLLNNAGVTWLAKTVISGNATGVSVLVGTANSYGDNYIRDNGTPVNGSLTPVTAQ
jgi:hypothetical protein